MGFSGGRTPWFSVALLGLLCYHPQDKGGNTPAPGQGETLASSSAGR